MTKDVAITASNFLSDIAIAESALDDIYNRDSICELPAEVRASLYSVLETYINELEEKLRNL